MATRPIFISSTSDGVGVKEKSLDFKWHPGFSKSQKQKSITELHKAAKTEGIKNVLEVSSKSHDDLGVKLSAFNLTITTKKKKNKLTVETAFQGSKVFKNGGPYTDLYGENSLAAKKDNRLKESGRLIAFHFFGTDFNLKPRTYFYDWVYIKALEQHEELKNEVAKYEGFSDIEFNPKKSINCQAHSVALFVSLSKNNVIKEALKSPEIFLELTKEHYSTRQHNNESHNSII